MKTLEDIKEEYAREMDYSDWEEFIYSVDDPDIVDVEIDEVANRFAREVAREALKNAAENARTNKVGNSGSWHDAGVDKQSILDESNIPEL